MTHVVALDVSKGKSMMVVYDQGKQCMFECEILHNRSSFEELDGILRDLTVQGAQAPQIVFEATGSYSKALERFLQDRSYAYCCMNPLEAKTQMAKMRRQKTDKGDAHELAKSHFKEERRETHHSADDYYDQMRALTRYYEEVSAEKEHLFNRMHAILQLSFSELESFCSTSSVLFLNIVQAYPHPDEVLDCSKTVLRNCLKKSTGKNISVRQAEEKSLVLIELAKNSYPAISRKDVRCEQLRDYAKRMTELNAKKARLVKQMDELSKDRKEYQILLSIPGIGKVTAGRIIGELGDINRFHNHKQLNAYVGIDMMRYQSGTIYKKDKINKRGNKNLRRILFYMIQTMLSWRKKKRNHLVDYYDKLKTQPQRKPHKVASIACVNKFLKMLFHLIQHDLMYDYEKATTNL